MTYDLDNLRTRYQTQIDLNQRRIDALDKLKEEHPVIFALDEKLREYIFRETYHSAEGLLEFYQGKDEAEEKTRLKAKFSTLIMCYQKIRVTCKSRGWRELNDISSEKIDETHALNQVIADRLETLDGMVTLLDLD